jgi:hypothetical protein
MKTPRFRVLGAGGGPYSGRSENPGLPVRFLHIVPDDKFVDEAHALFEDALPGGHDYVTLAPPRRHLIKTFEPAVAASAAEVRLLHRKLPRYDAVFVHFLDNSARLFVDRAPRSSRFVWIGWGADYYHLIRDQSELVLPRSLGLMRSVEASKAPAPAPTPARSILQTATRPVQAIRRHRNDLRMGVIGRGAKAELELLNRFELFAPVLRSEFDAIVDRNPQFRPRFAEWNYLSPGFDLLQDRVPMTCNILLGNSATPENNHLEAMQLIPTEALGARKVLCPLSYGDAAYGDSISALGRNTFGENFVPMRRYLGTDTYIDELRSCSIAVMNHVRQQGLGNIIMMLWLGARVFLRRENPIYMELASLGIEVFDIGELPQHLALPEPDVDQMQLLETRDRLSRRFGRKAILGMTSRLLSRACDNPGRLTLPG